MNDDFDLLDMTDEEILEELERLMEIHNDGGDFDMDLQRGSRTLH